MKNNKNDPKAVDEEVDYDADEELYQGDPLPEEALMRANLTVNSEMYNALEREDLEDPNLAPKATIASPVQASPIDKFLRSELGRIDADLRQSQEHNVHQDKRSHF